MKGEDVLSEQRRYYAERAPEYDDWWFRRGRYALDEAAHAAWVADVEEVERAVDALGFLGSVLELAAGTGLWTRRLARNATRVVAVDANVETLDLNRERVEGGDVEYVVADLFEWEPSERFDLCFFGFWLSHVPEPRFDEFWRLVRRSLHPDGHVFLLDSGGADRAHTTQENDELQMRSLADGREFQIVKRYWEPDALRARTARLGFELDLRRSANRHFLYGGGA
jgi:ubiquinone/menaquinone biosynthesis C-methylase UbiE